MTTGTVAVTPCGAQVKANWVSGACGAMRPLMSAPLFTVAYRWAGGQQQSLKMFVNSARKPVGLMPMFALVT